MEGRSKSSDRRLKRCYQCNGLEEQLWAMAYETVLPLVRRVVSVKAAPVPPAPGRIVAASPRARRA